MWRQISGFGDSLFHPLPACVLVADACCLFISHSSIPCHDSRTWLIFLFFFFDASSMISDDSPFSWTARLILHPSVLRLTSRVRVIPACLRSWSDLIR